MIVTTTAGSADHGTSAPQSRRPWPYNRPLEGSQQLRSLLCAPGGLVLVGREPAENAETFLDAAGVVPSVDVAGQRRAACASARVTKTWWFPYPAQRRTAAVGLAARTGRPAWLKGCGNVHPRSAARHLGRVRRFAAVEGGGRMGRPRSGVTQGPAEVGVCAQPADAEDVAGAADARGSTPAGSRRRAALRSTGRAGSPNRPQRTPVASWCIPRCRRGRQCRSWSI